MIDYANYFAAVRVISLERTPERLAAFWRRFPADWPFAKPERAAAFDGNEMVMPAHFTGPPGALGCLASHVDIVWLQCQCQYIKPVLILEDDAEFTRDAVERIKAVLEIVPPQTDILYLGGAHVPIIDEARSTPDKPVYIDAMPDPLAPGLVRCRNTARTHAYIIYPRFFDRFIDWLAKWPTHIDHALGLWAHTKDVNFLAIDPFVVIQTGGLSTISGRHESPRAWDERVNVTVREPSTVRIISMHMAREIVDQLKLAGMVHPGHHRDDQGRPKALARAVAAPEDQRPSIVAPWLSQARHEAADFTAANVGVWMPPAELAVIERTMKQIDCPFKVARGTTLEEATASVRRLGRPPLSPTYRPQVFYHCACMGHWREVMDSHFKLFESVGLTEKIWGCVLGDGDDGQEAYRIADRYGIQFVNEQTFLIPSNGLDAYEVPTLCLIERWAQDNPQGVCLYAHTKGVSAPHDEIKQDWRRLMDACVIENWYANLRMIQDVDAIGVDWQDSTTDPHFSGNFWMAQADWIRGLMPIRDFRQSRAGTRHIMNHPWERMCAEMWLGSKPHISIISLACRNVNLWSEPNARKFLDVLAEKKPKMTKFCVATPIKTDSPEWNSLRRRMSPQQVLLCSGYIHPIADVSAQFPGTGNADTYYHVLGNGDLVPTDFYSRLGSPTAPVIAVSLETSPKEILQLPVFACAKNRHAMRNSQFIVRGDVLDHWREIEPVYRPDLAVYHEALLPGKWDRIPI